MDKKFLVTEMTKSNKEKVKLKALKLGLTINELIINSIDVYSPDINCRGCDNLNPTMTYKHDVVAGVNKLSCTVENTPTLYCDSCNEEIYDMEFIASLNKAIEQAMLERFIKTKETSFVFNYNNIEAMD